MSRVGLILLAAGGSSRMGTAKQFLKIQDKSMISRAAQTATGSQCAPVVVVVGSQSKKAELELIRDPLITVKNDNWEMGIGSSIRTGMEAIIAQERAASESEAVLIMLCDQPMVTSALLNKMVAVHSQYPKKIIACAYANTIGVPVLFPRASYSELLSLSAKVGAKKLVDRHLTDVEAIEFPGGEVDLDTPQDYDSFTRQCGNKP